MIYIKRRRVLSYILTPVFALLLQFTFELTFRNDLAAVFEWMGNGFAAFMLSYLVVLALSSIFVACCGNIFAGFSIAVVVMFILAAANYLKYASLATVLVPYDIFKADLAGRFGDAINYNLPVAFWICVALWIAILFGGFMMLPPLRMSATVRGVAFTAACIFLLFMVTASGAKLIILGNLGIKYDILNADYTYTHNGLALGFVLHTRSALIKKPDNYDNIAREFLSYADDYEQPEGGDIDMPDNIVFLLSESFWDPLLLEGVYTSIDPLANFRRYARRSPSGVMISPSFGGATINVEFEVLTGLTLNALPRGTYPFLQYMDRELHTLPHVLQRYGYRCVGVHTYNKTFYNRDKVYPLLGFDEFYGLEDTNKYDVSGGYLSDELLSWMILDILNDVEGADSSVRMRKALDEEREKKFIFAISMENHIPYKVDKYDEYDVKLRTSAVEQEDLESLQSYAQGVYKADAALDVLIQGISEIEERTLLVFFGDHLPPFNNQAVYTGHGFIRDAQQLNWSAAEQYRTHNTPLLIWANYPIKNEELSIGSSFLASYVMQNYIGITDDEFFNVNYLLYTQSFTAINSQLVVDTDGNASVDIPARLRPAVDFYNGIVYDQLFGGNYIMRTLKERAQTLD